MLEKTGIPTKEQIQSAFPESNRLNQGPVAIIECFQPIPCDPCATSCPRQAIQPFADINDTPAIDNKSCNGCGICITKCPGLAIMVVDFAWSETKALLRLPYEFRPLPKEGETVHALDRAGAIVADADVVKITLPASKTAIVSIAVDKALVKIIRNIKLKDSNGFIESQYTDEARHNKNLHTQEYADSHQKSEIYQNQTSDPSILCRCSDIDIQEIRAHIQAGYTSVDEIKRLTRLGMGPCQGRTCIPLVMRELANALGKPMEALSPGTHRPVVKSIELGSLAAYSPENKVNNE